MIGYTIIVPTYIGYLVGTALLMYVFQRKKYESIRTGTKVLKNGNTLQQQYEIDMANYKTTGTWKQTSWEHDE